MVSLGSGIGAIVPHAAGGVRSGMATINERVLFVGGGNMAHAIVHGALGAGALSADGVAVVDPNAEKRGMFPMAFTDADEGRAWLGGGVLVLAVKPQMLGEAALAYGGHKGLCVSILAGTTSAAVSGRWGTRRVWCG